MSDPSALTCDAARCPLCGAGNQCEAQATAAQATGTQGGASVLCWCMTVQVPPSLLAQLPAAARGQSCICAACVAAAHRETSAR
ncbi:MAG: hypothetical protein EOO29_10495 [Comamonadaceae bacterium]|nr:MAG: hypothetical protein EOO29_10495 [Comamonadaceae bacterium]